MNLKGWHNNVNKQRISTRYRWISAKPNHSGGGSGQAATLSHWDIPVYSCGHTLVLLDGMGDSYLVSV
jgi:hypothetical protein